jgi:hypothetical protein
VSVARLVRVEAGQQGCEDLAVLLGERGEELLGGAAPGLAQLVADGGAAVGQVQQDRAAVTRIDLAADHASLLEVVDHRGQRARHDVEPVGDLRHPQRLLAARDHAQRAFLGRREAKRRQPFGLRPAQPPRQPVDQVGELNRVLVLHVSPR